MTLEGVLAAIAEERKTTEIAMEACKQHPELGKGGSQNGWRVVGRLA